MKDGSRVRVSMREPDSTERSGRVRAGKSLLDLANMGITGP